MAAQAKANKEKLPDTPQGQVMIDAMGQGRMGAQNLLRLYKTSPELLDAVVQKYPGFDVSKIESYNAAYKNFTSGKISGALNSAGTSLKHLAKLEKLNTPKSHIPGTPDYRAYMDQVHIAADELSKFYGGGAATISGAAKYEQDLGGIGPGREDAIKTTVQALGDKYEEYQQQWANAAPSAVYEAQMPGITPEAKGVLSRLDPNYQNRTYAQVQPQGGAAPPAAPGAGGGAPGTAAPPPRNAAPQPVPKPAGNKGTLTDPTTGNTYWTTDGKTRAGLATVGGAR
jgi:hypothetical protein